MIHLPRRRATLNGSVPLYRPIKILSQEGVWGVGNKRRRPGNRKSGIGNSEIGSFEIGQARYLKAEIRKLKTDLGDPDLEVAQNGFWKEPAEFVVFRDELSHFFWR
jgi:hypothetical protein